MGLLAEMLVRTYHVAGKSIYAVREKNRVPERES